MDVQGEVPGWGALLASPDIGRITVLSFGVWLHAADELMVSTITPAMIGDIGGTAFVAWLIALYEIGSIVAGALAAFAVLRIGLRTGLACAGLIYLGGCLIDAMAPDMAVMLAGRLVQGVGGGAMIAIAFVGVHRLVDQRFTARVYALISLVWGVSAFTGPIIGAAFADLGWWRGAFLFFAGQAAVFAVVSFRLIREPAGTMRSASAGGEVASIAIRVAVLSAGVVAVAAAGNVAAPLLAAALLVSGLALIGVFLRLDGGAGAARLLPSRPYDPRLAQGAVLAVVLLFSIATVALITYGPLLMNRLHGLDALAIGLILLLESAGWSIVAVAIAGLARRHEAAAIFGGFAAVTAGVSLLAVAMPLGPVALIATCALAQGGGMGAAWAFMVRRTTVLTAAEERDRAVSAIPTVQRLGFALGAAMIGIIANAGGFGENASPEIATTTALRVYGLSAIPAIIGLFAVIGFLRLGDGTPAKAHER